MARPALLAGIPSLSLISIRPFQLRQERKLPNPFLWIQVETLLEGKTVKLSEDDPHSPEKFVSLVWVVGLFQAVPQGFELLG